MSANSKNWKPGVTFTAGVFVYVGETRVDMLRYSIHHTEWQRGIGLTVRCNECRSDFWEYAHANVGLIVKGIARHEASQHTTVKAS